MLIAIVSFDNINRPVTDSPTKQSIWANNTGKTYNYFCDDNTVKPGDKVIVESPSSGYTIVDVLDVRDKILDDYAAKWIVCRVNDEGYKARKAAVERRAVILKALNEKAKKVKEAEQFRYLASIDQDAAALLTELDELEGRKPALTAAVVPDPEALFPAGPSSDRKEPEQETGWPGMPDGPESTMSPVATDGLDMFGQPKGRRPKPQTSVDFD